MIALMTAAGMAASKAYWTPMKKIFADGTTSRETRAKVKIDSEQRIKTGRFRRTLSKHA
jgi:hypothetical protein